ncbi:MAG TPA: hypothetical protein VEJ67_06295 [Candidatus Cybelea sp.]|nr:hypothetical protein [Candidatus Cybelea sp.]
MNIAKWGVVAALFLFPGVAAAGRDQTNQPAQQSDQKQAKTQVASDKSGSSGATAQQQQDPLAAAARRAREEKKQQPKAAKVWTNDNIPSTPSNISVVGEGGSVESDATETKADQGGAGPAQVNGSQSQEDRKVALETDLAAAKEQLKSVRTDWDILSRKYVLDQQTYYGKPDFASDTVGAVKLKDEEAEIASKKQDVDAAQKKVDDLTAQLKDLEEEGSKSANDSQ